ncbi:hypothetical protein F4778DRAFT_745980 [Xylariomycetidae sp. FL2044]|nr:hypothetical protein F4778DRAFT_745980 [Xylariomycetidae sp. FL2044]
MSKLKKKEEEEDKKKKEEEEGKKKNTAREDWPGWMDALDRWSRVYEENRMVPVASNDRRGWTRARSTTCCSTRRTAWRWRPFVRKVVSAVLEDRLRMAMRHRRTESHPQTHYHHISPRPVVPHSDTRTCLGHPSFSRFRFASATGTNPDGYHIREVVPEALRRKGGAEMDRIGSRRG